MELKVLIIPTAVQVLLLAFQSVLFLGVQNFQGPYHDMARPIDRKIPLIPQAIYIYILWYPLIAMYPLYLYYCCQRVYFIYFFAIVFDIACSLLIYLKYPTSFERPPAPDKGLTGWIFKLIRTGNYRGLNCMPSMHCSMCFIIIFSAGICSTAMPSGVQAGVCILACLIVCSTVLTKQHVLADVAAAFLLALICMVFSKIFCAAVC